MKGGKFFISVHRCSSVVPKVPRNSTVSRTTPGPHAPGFFPVPERHSPMRGTKAKEKYHAHAPIRHSRAGGNPEILPLALMDSRLRGNDVVG